MNKACLFYIYVIHNSGFSLHRHILAVDPAKAPRRTPPSPPPQASPAPHCHRQHCHHQSTTAMSEPTESQFKPVDESSISPTTERKNSLEHGEPELSHTRERALTKLWNAALQRRPVEKDLVDRNILHQGAPAIQQKQAGPSAPPRLRPPVYALTCQCTRTRKGNGPGLVEETPCQSANQRRASPKHVSPSLPDVSESLTPSTRAHPPRKHRRSPAVCIPPLHVLLLR